ncbi:MAG: hypothetical protein ACJ72N_06430 [Labedaea sp.]
MELSSIGPWIAVAAAIPALVILVVSIVALRGTTPSERPAILRALADLFRATRRIPGPRRSARKPTPGDDP